MIDTGTDTVLGQFATAFYGEDLIFNAAGTRLYVTNRFNDQVRAFSIAKPFITQIAAIPTGATQLDRTNPRDLTLSADGNTLYVANTLRHTIGVINVAGDANQFVKTIPVGGLSTDVKVALRDRVGPRDQQRAQRNGDRTRDAEGRGQRRHQEQRAHRSAIFR